MYVFFFVENLGIRINICVRKFGNWPLQNIQHFRRLDYVDIWTAHHNHKVLPYLCHS